MQKIMGQEMLEKTQFPLYSVVLWDKALWPYYHSSFRTVDPYDLSLLTQYDPAIAFLAGNI